MKKIELGDRQGKLAFLDMSGRSKPKNVKGHNVFRIGDRAAAHLWVLQWRKNNPEARIIVIDDPLWNKVQQSFLLDAQWVFQDLVDELWLADKFGETIEVPAGYVLYHTQIWKIWEWLRAHRNVSPTILPPAQAEARAVELIGKYGVPPRFVTVQPLFDAPYSKHRNAPAEWWQEVVTELSKKYPVVLLGDQKNVTDRLRGCNVFPLWESGLTPLDSLALIVRAGVHVGGETGLTLWASMVHTPVVAVYALDQNGVKTVKPIAFEAPVLFAQLKGSVCEVVKRVAEAMAFWKD